MNELLLVKYLSFHCVSIRTTPLRTHQVDRVLVNDLYIDRIALIARLPVAICGQRETLGLDVDGQLVAMAEVGTLTLVAVMIRPGLFLLPESAIIIEDESHPSYRFMTIRVLNLASPCTHQVKHIQLIIADVWAFFYATRQFIYYVMLILSTSRKQEQGCDKRQEKTIN